MAIVYGKCKFRNMQNGILCGCLRSRVQSNDDYSCKACDHDLCYHEINNNKRKNNRKNKSSPYKRPITFKLIYLFGGKSNPKIPRGINRSEVELMKQIQFTDNSNDGIKKSVEALFPNLEGKYWRFFRCISTSNLEIAPEPVSGWSIDSLEDITCARKKLYVGAVDEPITPSLTNHQFQPNNIPSNVPPSIFDFEVNHEMMEFICYDN